jgi:hypothetical protein
MTVDESIFKDSLAVNRAQNNSTKILRNYLISKTGEIQANRSFNQLLTTIFRIRSATKRTRDFLQDQFMTTDTVTRIAPLMQTFLHIL